MDEPSDLYRNSTGDEAVYVHAGTLRFESVYGPELAADPDCYALDMTQAAVALAVGSSGAHTAPHAAAPTLGVWQWPAIGPIELPEAAPFAQSQFGAVPP